ncbi:E3 SUMO-protein ligase gei-17-like [Rhopalosiphum maidis]|uniref:E3 SUMO-protein ligase gei-17-like n=1 Tax=Rhopalosiphum maidis TaxID=43146 RepID=UPI000F00C102|nr:E3 SUMO-protein ligase gei-17-like [Rhopalosiphum maidis]XP_026818104.1 E3 SUMO-protein ligase gei-17-like [Rhopalosiphum maidis]XP_026818105.1 E3 SUMO-protein ligase gei-17-like [Rhopalosiphum maidis]
MSELQPSSRKLIILDTTNSTYKSKYNVVFTPQPYYKNICTLIEPVAIYCDSAVKSECGQSQEHTQFEFKFTLSKLIIDMVKRQIKRFQFQIRFGEKLAEESDLSDGLPGPIDICFNLKHSSTTKRSPITYDGDTLDKENEISILWPFCKKTYYMALNIVETISIENLIARVFFHNKIYSIKLNTKAKAIELMKNSGKDSASYEYLLLCSITQTKMKIPTRSLNCSHFKCFDLNTFIIANKIKPTWVCPICRIPIPYYDLAIDLFILNIIINPNLPKNCFGITLYANGEWEPYTVDIIEGIENNYPKYSSLKDLNNPYDENLPVEKPFLPITNGLNTIEQTLSDLTIDSTDIKKEPSTKILKTEDADE